jgi:hypothetical protein
MTIDSELKSPGNRAPRREEGATAGEVPWMRAIMKTTDLRQSVSEAHGTGATGIKLYTALDSTLARRITAEAYRQRMRVWAHAALNPATPPDVVGASSRRCSSRARSGSSRVRSGHHPACAPHAGVILTAGTDSLVGADDVLPNILAELEWKERALDGAGAAPLVVGPRRPSLLRFLSATPEPGIRPPLT